MPVASNELWFSSFARNVSGHICVSVRVCNEEARSRKAYILGRVDVTAFVLHGNYILYRLEQGK
jgi:hypothetical protein